MWLRVPDTPGQALLEGRLELDEDGLVAVCPH
jgi:hypothetical protein